MAVTIPMPGDLREDNRVIASTWTAYDDNDMRAMLLLLNPSQPFYSVVEVRWNGSEWEDTTDTAVFHNIVPAVEFYADNGGDY